MKTEYDANAAFLYPSTGEQERRVLDLQSTHSIPILSPNPSPMEQEAAAPPERKRKEADTQSAYEIYREIIKDNISYDILMQDMKFDGDRLDEIVDLMLETVCTRRKTIRIAGDDYPQHQAVFTGGAFQCPVHYWQLLHVPYTEVNDGPCKNQKRECFVLLTRVGMFC